MANSPPTKDERDANLDALKSAVDEWADTETTRLENEVQFMRAVLKGRGAEDAATKNLAAGALKAVGEIDDFLVGT